MQSQVLVQPPPLLALAHQTFPHSIPRALLHPYHLPTDNYHLILDKAQPSAAQSSPTYSPTLHLLLDTVPRSGPRDHASSTSPQQYSISGSSPSQPTPHFPASHPRTLSPSDSSPDTEFSVHTSPSSSPSQIDPTSLFQPPPSAPHHLDQSSANTYIPNMDRYSIVNLADRYLRGSDKYSHNQLPLLDQCRMSEQAMRGSAAGGYPTTTADLSSPRYHQLQHQYSYGSPRSYGSHSTSPLHRSSDTRSISGSSWKEDHRLSSYSYDSIDLEEPLSPLDPTFSGGESSPPMGMSPAMFDSLYDDYGPSPPGTGTSTSSSALATHQQAHITGGQSPPPDSSKQYSFVSLPGNAMKKRPRRRYDEIERLYQCSWPDCAKAYGTLNHLNAHITMQKHGTKRSPNGKLHPYPPSTIPRSHVTPLLYADKRMPLEFKELRKQWRKAKKEEAEVRAFDAMRHESHQHQHSPQHLTSRHSMSDAEYQTHNARPPFDYAHHPERSIQSIGPLDDFHDPLIHQQGVYPNRSQRYTSFVSSHPEHSGIQYSHSHAHGASTSNIPMDRLPANSTLLTPLPGYESSSMSGAPGFNAYESYDLYRGDGRPRTGHRSPESHSDRGRPRSSHVNLGIGHDRDCP